MKESCYDTLEALAYKVNELGTVGPIDQKMEEMVVNGDYVYSEGSGFMRRFYSTACGNNVRYLSSFKDRDNKIKHLFYDPSVNAVLIADNDGTWETDMGWHWEVRMVSYWFEKGDYVSNGHVCDIIGDGGMTIFHYPIAKSYTKGNEYVWKTCGCVWANHEMRRVQTDAPFRFATEEERRFIDKAKDIKEPDVTIY